MATLDGRIEYFGTLVERYSARIRRLVGGMVGSSDDADDLTQEIFVQAWTKLDTFRRRSSFSTWLYRIAYNTTISALRRKRLPVAEIDDRRMESIEEEEELRRFDDADIDLLSRALDHLRPNERVAVEMFYRDDCSLSAVGEVLGITEGNAKVVLHRARRHLAAEMATR